MIFKRIHPALLEESTGSRESNLYIFKTLELIGFNVLKSIPLQLWLFVLMISFLMNFVIYNHVISPAELLQSLQLGINSWCLSLKLLTLKIYMQDVEDANKCFDALDKFCVTKREKLAIRRIVAKGNKLYLAFATVYFCYVTSSFIGGLIQGHPPFNIYIPFLKWREDNTELIIHSVIEYFVISHGISAGTVVDSYAVIFVNALLGHMSLLKARVERLGMDVSEEGNFVSDNEKYKQLVECIKAHKIMLDFCASLRPLISCTIFAQFVLCGSILGIASINLVAFADNSARLGILSYMIAVTLQSFPLCYLCNCLVDECSDLSDAVFHSKWPDQTQCYKKSLLQFIQKVQQPMTFSALGIFDINLATNINVAKFAFTVYAIANGVNLEEKLRTRET